MIYIHAAGTFNITPESKTDTKAELKALTGKVFRRTDRFIQLSLLGAHKAAGERALSSDTALYMTSGQGNLAVFNRVRDQKFLEHQLPKPVDFINMLSNSAGFYVAQHLGLNGKNLFLSHHRFPVEMSLIMAINDLRLGKVPQALVGGVDEMTPPESLSRKLLGICDKTPLGEGSSWLLLGTDKKGALASLEVVPVTMDAEELASFLLESEPDAQVAFGMRLDTRQCEALLGQTERTRFAYEARCGFYETNPFFALTHFLQTSKGTLLFIDSFDEEYMVMKVKTAG
jgi:hypothetical protein